MIRNISSLAAERCSGFLYWWIDLYHYQLEHVWNEYVRINKSTSRKLTEGKYETIVIKLVRCLGATNMKLRSEWEECNRKETSAKSVTCVGDRKSFLFPLFTPQLITNFHFTFVPIRCKVTQVTAPGMAWLQTALVWQLFWRREDAYLVPRVGGQMWQSDQRVMDHRKVACPVT